MLPYKNILIVSASIGAGHTQAAKALATEIRHSHPHADVQTVDFLADKKSHLSRILKTTYFKLLAVCPNVYDFLYRWSAQGSHSPKVQHILAQATKHNMLALLRQYQPDLLVFTHPFPCAAAAYLKNQRLCPQPLAAIITDFAIHPLWIHKEVDFYFVAGKELETDLLSQGLPAARIFTTGIPIAPQFVVPLPQHMARAKLQLDQTLSTVLVMGGGLGLGSLKETLLELNKLSFTLQLVFIAGNNETLRRELDDLAPASKHVVKVFGFTDKVDLFMAAADLLITKPGGLTISEALSVHLPMLFYNPLPGQEEDNAAYLEQQGTAVWVRKQSQLTPIIQQLFQAHDKFFFMKQQGEKLRHPLAASQIVKLLYQSANDKRNASGM